MINIYNKCVLGGNIFSFLKKNNSHKLINKSLELGINSIDTSDSYGNGISEEYIGEILKKIPRSKIKIFTKAGTKTINEANGLYNKENIVKKLNHSLKRLNTDYIDIYQLHNYDEITPVDEIFGTLENLKIEGKILNYGVSNFNKSHLINLKKKNLLKYIFSNQVHYNLVNRQNIELSKFSKILVYGVLARGLFRNNPENSFRRLKSSNIDNDKNSKIFKLLFNLLTLFAKDNNISITDIAINFTLSNKDIYKVIFGLRTIDQLLFLYNSINTNYKKKIYYNKLIEEIDKITNYENIKMFGNFYD